MKIKKIVSCLMAMVIAISLFAGTAVTASANAFANFSFTDTDAYAGEPVVVDVHLRASGLSGFQFEVDYDMTKLTLTDVKLTEEFKDVFSMNSPGLTFNALTTTVVYLAGTLEDPFPDSSEDPLPDSADVAFLPDFDGVALQLFFDVPKSARGEAHVAVSEIYDDVYQGANVSLYLEGSSLSWPLTGKRSCTVNISERVPLKGLSLDGNSFTMNAGTSANLGPLVIYSPANASEKAIDWKSSKPNVASVDSDGRIKALTPGTTIITGTSRNNSSLVITATIIVPTPVAGVSLAKTASVKEKATLKLTPTITPSNATDKFVTWTSDKPSVATVSYDGVVTGVKAGKANITVTTYDGNWTATCVVTVTAAGSTTTKRPATGLTVPTATVNGVVNKTTKITYTIKPSNSTDKPTFSSSNPKIATVDAKGNITGKKAGTVTITVKVGKITKKFKVTIHNYVTLKIESAKAIHNGTNTTVDQEGTKPFLVGGRTMIPIRFVGEKMGGKVKYVSDSKPIILTYEGVTVSITLNSKTMLVTAANGKTSKITLDVAAQKRNGRTFIPLRAVSQALGFTVYYQATTKYIVVNNPKMNVALRNVRLAAAKGYLK